MRFDELTFQAAARSGACDPPRIVAPLFRPSRMALRQLGEARDGVGGKSLHDHYQQLSLRMSDNALGALRVATALAWRGANGYFPAYRYHAGEFLNDEWLACVDWHKPFHRDHVSHQVMCYWVATRLLNAGTGDLTFGGQTLHRHCLLQVLYAPQCQYLRDYADQLGVFANIPKAFKSFVWEALFEEAVFLATMYHDIGYPWQFVQSIATQLSNHSPLPLMPMAMGLAELYDAYGARLLCYPFQDYSPPTPTQPAAWRQRTQRLLAAGQAKTHGLPGALAFLYLNDILRQYPDPTINQAAGVFCLEWAALAILMHDLQKLYVGNARRGNPPENPQLRVRFQRDPLSFLLTLVDQIQDFCRPSASFTPAANSVKLRYQTCCCAVEVMGSAYAPLDIVYCYKNWSDYAQNSVEYKPQAQREYFDPASGYMDWTGLPISSIRLSTRYEP